MGSLITETPYSEITATLEILGHLGVGRDDLRKFRAASPAVQKHIVHFLKTADTCVAISSTNIADRPDNKFTVDYSQTLEQMIAAGHYNWVNSNITQKNFPFSGSGVVELETKLFYCNRTISSEDAVRAIEADGWQVAQIEHLLAFGAKNPEEQRKYPIVALGSSAPVDDYRYVPVLNRDGSERSLILDWWGSVWYDVYRFLAVRNLCSAA